MYSSVRATALATVDRRAAASSGSPATWMMRPVSPLHDSMVEYRVTLKLDTQCCQVLHRHACPAVYAAREGSIECSRDLGRLLCSLHCCKLKQKASGPQK